MLLNAMKKPDGSYRTYAEMVAENIPLRYDGKWVAAACTACSSETGQGNPFPIYMYEVFMPEVEVDMETGKVKVVKFTTVGGRRHHHQPRHGGRPDLRRPRAGHRPCPDRGLRRPGTHTTLRDCGLPYPKDIPDDMEIIYLETPRPHGPFGAAGVGEAPLTAPHPAILNAIYNACGVRIFRVPALAEVIKLQLDAQKGQPVAQTAEHA